jgi:undecaprenyl-diphosphatase
MEQLTILQAIVLGIVQGLTEFLPISSTAHLRIVPALAGWKDIGAEATAVMQLGTLLAVLLYFWSDLWRLTRAFIVDGLAWLRAGLKGAPWGSQDAKIAWLIGVGTIPICVFGLLFKDFIKGGARSLWVQVATLISLGLILLVAERVATLQKELADIGWTEGLAVGAAQAVALLPGSSRSGTTITAALFCGLTREAAARFSFLLSVPAVLLSGVYELYEIRASVGGPGTPALVVATVVSFVVGYASIAFLLKFLRTHTTIVFVGYRVALGLLLAGLLLGGVLSES